MQSNSLYAHADDVWMSDWPMMPSTAADTDGFGAYDSGDSAEFASSAHHGYTGHELYQYQVWDTPQAAEMELQPSSFSYSAAFNEHFVDPDGNAPDFDLVASDGVHFAVTAPKLRSSSSNDFGGLLASSSSSAVIPLSASVLNLVLHGVYGLSPATYAPNSIDLGPYP